jgi:CHAT domain-containing protein/tetratricopeptide (TPR) repeat protein
MRHVQCAAAAVILFTAANTAWAAQSLGDTLKLRAEEHFKNSELVQAERLFREALPTLQGDDKRLCYERLLTIYYRLAQYDRAITFGEAYRQWLAQTDDKRKRRLVLHQVAICYLVLGHYSKADERFKEVLSAQPEPVSPVVKIEALSFRAQIAEKLNHKEEAGELWQAAKDQALYVLRSPLTNLKWSEIVSCIARLSESYRFLGQHKEAVTLLEGILTKHDNNRDVAGKCESLRMLAGHQTELGDHELAEQNLRAALLLYARLDKKIRDPVRQGDLSLDLAEVLEREDKTEEAKEYRQNAADFYSDVIKGYRDVQPDHQSPEIAFWKLQRLYQRVTDYRKALNLAEEQLERVGGLDASSHFKAERGILHLYRELFEEADSLLSKAVEDLQDQTVANLIDLPRALNALAVVEQAKNNLKESKDWAERALALYKKHGLPDDLVKVESYNILGTSEALRGSYEDARKLLLEGVELCKAIGPSSDRQLSNLYLNIALIFRSQGETSEASKYCEFAAEAFARLPDGKDKKRGYAYYLAGMAGLAVAQSQFNKAGEHARVLLELCDELEIKDGPLVLTAWHCQALEALQKKDFALARKLWIYASNQQKKTKDPLWPRTLNYLGLTEELEGKFTNQLDEKLKSAKAYYEQALNLQKGDNSYPATSFVTLWRMAGVHYRAGQRDKARDLLEKAVSLVEDARLRSFNNADQKAVYFAQFAPAYERLVDYTADVDPVAAFGYAAQSRSRVLLDQLQVAGINPLASLPENEKYLAKEVNKLLDDISRLQLRSLLLPEDDIEAKKLRTELDKSKNDFKVLWQKVINLSPVLRPLAASNPPAELLNELRTTVLRPGNVLLNYHIGAERSYLLLVRDTGDPEKFHLKVPTGLVKQLAKSNVEVAKAELKVRGFDLAPAKPNQQLPLPIPVGESESAFQPLTEYSAQQLVDYHLQLIRSKRDFLKDRELRVGPVDFRQVEKASTPLLLTAIAESLLPKEVRDRVRQLKPSQLIVIPDGALHAIPLESLLLESGHPERYVLDDGLPPMIYAPSTSILGLLAKRPAPPTTVGKTLLTVCDPIYPAEIDRLAGTAEESRNIRRLFDPTKVTKLEGIDATVPAVRANLRGQRFVHLAMHGKAETKNEFGALYLSFSAEDGSRKTSEKDGYLSLHEIYNLNLKDCELAVLSACETNRSNRNFRSLEAGASLANGFLTAGAQQVVASFWSVQDDATAALMSAFFEEAMVPRADGKTISYALALQNARKRLRSQAKTALPVRWAPFVLIGTGIDAIDAGTAELPPGRIANAEQILNDVTIQGKALEEESSRINILGQTWIVSMLGLAVLLAIVVFAAVVARYRRNRIKSE